MKQLIAVSWVMPPIVLPRSIQIARTLKVLAQRGWNSEIYSVPTEAVPGATLDDELVGLYRSCYTQLYIEHRESQLYSPALLRAQRRWRPPASTDEDNWIRRGAATVVQRARATDAAALITFAQPWVDHLLGLRAKRLDPTLPWLVHFSDPWTDSPYYKIDTPEKAAQMEIWRSQEREVIASADAVAFVTEQTADLVMRKYPPGWLAKVHVVPHGFDRDALPARPATATPLPGAGPLRLVYTGNIYAGARDPSRLFEAIVQLGGAPALASRLHLHFYGNRPVEVLAQCKALGLDGIVSFHGNVGYQESLRAAATADVLLLLDAPSDVNVFLPSKIVDYLMLDLPILGLTPEAGASAAILRKAGHVIVPPLDAAAIAAAVRGLLERHAAGQPLVITDRSITNAFDIQRTTDAFEAALSAAMYQGRRS